MLKFWREEKQKDRDLQVRLAEIAAQTSEFNFRLQQESMIKIVELQTKGLEKMSEMVAETAKQGAKSADVLAAWLEGFKVTSDPKSTVMRDRDEIESYLGVEGKNLPERELSDLLRTFNDMDNL